MSRSKRPRKKYNPRKHETIPTWTLDAMGQLTEDDFRLFEDAIRSDISLIRMGTWDKGRYWNLLFAVKHFYCFAVNFQEKMQMRLLASMATAAIHGLKELADEKREGNLSRQDLIPCAVAPLELAMDTYLAVMRASYRSEHETARRAACRLNLTEAVGRVAKGGIAIVAPDETDGEVCRLGVPGVAFVNSACEAGYLARNEQRHLFWMIPERKAFVRIANPTLMFFVEDHACFPTTPEFPK